MHIYTNAELLYNKKSTNCPMTVLMITVTGYSVVIVNMKTLTGQAHWTKLRFPTCPAYQQMTFPTHIWQRIGQNFMQTNEMCINSCPILQTSYTYKIQIFI